ncbi:MAG: hypothetical protein Q8L66_01235 [Caulobacter sp.]|nr:hypothetical protein [Caulobacter sp.]
MDFSASGMVVPSRGRFVDPTILIGVRRLVRRNVHVGRIMIIESFDKSHSRPIGCMGPRVLRLDHAMRVERRQHGDAQTDTDVAKKVRQ